MTDSGRRWAPADDAERQELHRRNAPLVRVALVASGVGAAALAASLLVDPWLQLGLRLAAVGVLGVFAVRTYWGLARNSREVRSGRR